MNFKSLILGLIAGLFSFQALACNIYYAGANNEFLECRTNYKNMGSLNGDRIERISELARNFVLGRLQELSNESWAIRQVLTVDEDRKSMSKKGEAKALVNAINDQLRRRAETMDRSGLDNLRYAVPAAWFFGVTVPFKEIPFNKIFSKIPAVQLSGSAMIGAILVPQLITMRIDNKGNNVPLEGLERLTFDYRLVIIPSGDGRAGADSRLKQTGKQWGLGLIFGENIFMPHQLLGHGYAASVPTKAAAVAPGLRLFSPFIKAADMIGVDTIKFGVSNNSRSLESDPSDDSINNYSDNVWLWLRWDNGNKLDDESVAQATVKSFAQGKPRVSAFAVIGAKNDGETTSIYNGLGGEGGAVFSSLLKEAAGEYISPEDVSAIADLLDQLTPDDQEKLQQEMRSRQQASPVE